MFISFVESLATLGFCYDFSYLFFSFPRSPLRPSFFSFVLQVVIETSQGAAKFIVFFEAAALLIVGIIDIDHVYVLKKL